MCFLCTISSREHIQNLLEAGHNTALRNEITTYVGSSKKRMGDLMHFFFHEKWRYGQRASWSIGQIGCKQPKLIAPYLEEMVKRLDGESHDAVKRNTVRIFQDIDIPEDLEGPLFDKCLDFVIDTKIATAIRCFAITVCGKIANNYPELQEELVAVAQEYMPHGSAGFKYRCRKLIKRFST